MSLDRPLRRAHGHVGSLRGRLRLLARPAGSTAAGLLAAAMLTACAPAPVAPSAAPAPAAPAAARLLEGTLPSGATWRFELPAAWNGTVLLYSHGYARGPANPARHHAGAERPELLARGYALIGSSYARTGWAVAEAVDDQIATLDTFVRTVGTPRQVLAWGSSMGGLVTVALMERHPQRFAGGLAMCASAAGTLGMMNQALDGAFVFATLAAPADRLPLRLGADGADLPAQQRAWQQALDRAQATPLGRARVALAASIAQTAAWADGSRPPPAVDDLAGQQQALARNLLGGILLPRDDQERRAGGNFSWNIGVDFAAQLQASGRQAFVQALYAQAGADLSADLATLAAAPRVAAQPAAVAYMHRHYVPHGALQAPLLVLQTTVDPLTLPEFSADYLRLAQAAGQGERVRGAWVQRVGHCRFTVPEVVAALQAVQQRAEGRPWATTPAQLQAAAATVADGAAAFVAHQPAPLLRSCWARPGACPGLVLPPPGASSRGP